MYTIIRKLPRKNVTLSLHVDLIGKQYITVFILENT